MEISNVISKGKLKGSSDPFIQTNEIIALHIFRYNRLTNELIAVKDLDEKDVDGKIISWKMFFAAREKRIKAYVDCIGTLTQKEQLLQFHNKEFAIEINNEQRIVVQEEKSKFDVDKLSFEETRELHYLMKKSKDNGNNPISVKLGNSENVYTESTIIEINGGRPNVELIKHEELPVPNIFTQVTNPTSKLISNLNKIAAEKFKEVGNLTEEEENLIK